MLSRQKGEARELQGDEAICLNPRSKRNFPWFTKVCLVQNILKVKSQIDWDKGNEKYLVVKSQV